MEIDLIIDRPGEKKLLIESKSKDKVDERERERERERDAKSLENLGQDIPKSERWLLSCDPLEQKFGATRALHWQKALQELFDLK